MADEIQKDRSPRCPRISLEEALKLTKVLHGKIGKNSVTVESARGALGFGGDNGAAGKILASLKQYGLIERSKGQISLAPSAIHILHPVSDKQRALSLQKTALNSSIFVRIRKEFDDCEQDVLANQLVQLGFTPDGAARTAQIYKANAKYARLDLIDPNSLEIIADDEEDSNLTPEEKPKKSTGPRKKDVRETPQPAVASDTFSRFFSERKKTIAVPLGSGETIQIPYPMTEEDFTLLLQTLKLWKKRIVTPP